MAITDRECVKDTPQAQIILAPNGSGTYDEVSATNPLPVTATNKVEKVTYTATVAKSATETIGPFSMEQYGALTVLILAQREGTFDVDQQLEEDSTSATSIINDQATVAATLYTTARLEVVQGWAVVKWTNGDASNSSTLVVQVVKEAAVGSDEVTILDSAAVELFSDTNPASVQLRTAAGATLGTAADPLPVGLTTAAGAAIGEAAGAPIFTEPVDSAGVEIFSDANPASVQLRTAAGDAVGTAADPLPVGLTTAAGAAIGEAAAAPLFGELVNSSAAELFTTTTPGQVEALITDGAGTAVSQSVSADYATITVWEVAAQAVTQAATYTGTGRDCLYMKDIAVSAHATQASSADGCLVQESNDNSTWYTLSKCTLAANTNTILYAGPRTRRYVRVVYTEGDAGAATLNTSISASPQ